MFCCLVAIMMMTAWPQQSSGQQWQQLMDELMTTVDADDETAADWTESYELLEELAAHPIDLNTATAGSLEQLPFLTAQQVMDIMEYLYRYGPMRSLGELRLVPSLDYRQLALLPFFVFVDQQPDTPADSTFPRMDSLFSRARHTLTATMRLPLYERAGDVNGYLGYRPRHSLRYELTSSNRLRLGLMGAQDSGEPFLSGKNRWGYDAWTAFLQLKQVGPIANVVVGKYRLSAGHGLVLGQSFQLGKLASLQNLGRPMLTLRPHSSRSEADYFLGLGATVSLSRRLSLTAFASHRPIDATLNADGTARTLVTSGYHRTVAEMDKKNNTHITAAGARMEGRWHSLRLGVTTVASALDRELQPQRQTLFRRHQAHGRHFVNTGIDYTLTHSRLLLTGETATDGHGALATLNNISLQPSARFSMMAQQRFYSYRYTSLYGHAPGNQSRPQNESAAFLGLTWQPLARLTLQGYADYAYYPWARQQTSFSAHATDLLLQATWQQGCWKVLARHRSYLKQRDNTTKTALVANNDHRERLSISYSSGAWSLRSQLDLSASRYQQLSRGWMVSQQAVYSRTAVDVAAMAALFHTDDYASRIYVAERQLQHEFYFPTYYGEGLRLLLQARADVYGCLRLSARVGYTNYFDRSVIGSGLQQIARSHATDVDLQLCWRF